VSDRPPDEAPEESEASPFPPPPQWLQTLIIVVALFWGTIEVAFLGARMESFGFIFSVLALSLGARVLGNIRGILR